MDGSVDKTTELGDGGGEGPTSGTAAAADAAAASSFLINSSPMRSMVVLAAVGVDE